MQEADAKIGAGKTGVAVAGAGMAQGLEVFHHLTLADIVSCLTIAFISYQFGCMIWDRHVRPRLKRRK